MVNVGVGEDDEVNTSRIKCKSALIVEIGFLTTLCHPAVEQKAASATFNEKA